jgi:hypothetical protein
MISLKIMLLCQNHRLKWKIACSDIKKLLFNWYLILKMLEVRRSFKLRAKYLYV